MVSPSGSSEQSRRIAIASSTPPSQASFFWNTWTTTRGRRHERPHEMPAAALVLARRALPVLVAADRDVLRAVVRGEVPAAQREHRRRDRGDGREQLPCNRS